MAIERRAANSDIPLSQIKIADDFWNRYRDLVGSVIIPYQWDVLNDALEGVETSHCIENFRIAAGRAEGSYYGMVFQDTDLAKWLEAVGFYLSASGRDEKLEALADEAIRLIGEAQQEDGYLDTYFTILEPEHRWQNLQEGHELYTAGHMIEAAVAYYEATGKEEFLKIVMRLADLLCRTFGTGEGQNHGYPGHPEVEAALVKLYRATGERRYLDLAKYFIDIRGVGENYFLKEQKGPKFKRIFPELAAFSPEYFQSHLPVREQKTAEGHAVRAGYLYSAMCDVAEEYEDPELLESCRTIWDNMVHRRMYVTGSIGSSGYLERFTTDYDLPSASNYSESCASIALAMFGKRMARVTGEAAYMDEVERALYNTVLAGIGMDGKHFFYVNPLEVWPAACMPETSMGHVKPKRQTWFGVACCPPNIARTLASVGQYMYFLTEKRLSINLYMSAKTELELAGIPAELEVETQMPWQGQVRICLRGKDGASLQAAADAGAEIALRLPWYAQNPVISVNGQKVDDQQIQAARSGKGYVVLKAEDESMVIDLCFDMPPMLIRANPQVRAAAGRVALMKGPLVYCLEQTDNGENLAQLVIDPEAEVKERFDPDLLGGTVVLEAAGWRCGNGISGTPGKGNALYYCRQDLPEKPERVTLTAVPYCFWGNRRPGEEMTVWIREAERM